MGWVAKCWVKLVEYAVLEGLIMDVNLNRGFKSEYSRYMARNNMLPLLMEAVGGVVTRALGEHQISPDNIRFRITELRKIGANVNGDTVVFSGNTVFPPIHISGTVISNVAQKFVSPSEITSYLD